MPNTVEKIPSICPHCGSRYQVGAAYAGKRIRCKHCPNSFLIQPLSESPANSAAHAQKPPFPIKRLIVGGSVAAAGICALVVFLQVRAANQNRALAADTLIRLVEQQIAQSVKDAEAFDFESANRALSSADTIVRDASVDLATCDSMAEKITTAKRSLRAAEHDHMAKIRDGWGMFEGSFISASDKKRVLDERHQKAEDEQRLARLDRERRSAEQQRQVEEADRLKHERENQRRAAVDAVYAEAVDLNSENGMKQFQLGVGGDSIERAKAQERIFHVLVEPPPMTVPGATIWKNQLYAVEFSVETKSAQIMIGFVYGEIGASQQGFLGVLSLPCTVAEAAEYRDMLTAGRWKIEIAFRVALIEKKRSRESLATIVVLEPVHWRILEGTRTIRESP